MPENNRIHLQDGGLAQVAIRMVQQPPLLANEPVNSPEAAIRVMNDFLSQMDRELFCIVNLQSDMKPINMNIVSVGALNEALVHPREILKSAILSNASGMMLIHNHPSGNLEPSEQDILTTDRMVRIGQLMGIPVVDHIIVGRGKEYYSFHERGTIPVVTQSFARDLEHLQFGAKVAENASVVSEPAAEMLSDAAVSPDQTKAVSTATIPLPVEGKDLNAVMQSLEKGMEDFLQGDESRYRQYLQVMTKFHSYSLNNTLLIAMQRPDATLCNSYKRWQGLGRQVRAGEKGIRIIAPAPIKTKRTREQKDGNQKTILGTDGKPLTEEVEVTIPRFKPTTIFAYEQTEGEPLPLLLPEELTASVENFELFMKAIEKAAPVPIRFDEIEGGAKGYYHTINKEIVIQKGMSELQTMKTAVHECAHSLLHDKDLLAVQGIQKDSMTKEVEAESVAFAVCQYFGLDTSDYSFPYIAGWSHSHDIKDVKASLDTVRKTAGQFIDDVSEQMKILIQEREASREQATVDEAVKDGNIMDSPEGRLLHGRDAMFGIYQIADGTAGEAYQFMGTDFVKSSGMTIAGKDYALIYTGELQPGQNLDQLYEQFNLHHPADYTSHSMSVSDVVVLNQNGQAQAFYVDSFGFTELPDFTRERSDMLLPKPDIDLVVMEQEELRNLAVKLDSFAYDFDPHAYGDAVEDREAALTELQADLSAGKVSYMRQWLQDIVDDGNANSPDQVGQAVQLMEKLDRIEAARGQHQEQARENGSITFYVAECSEFPIMGEYHENLTLEEALKVYDSIPSGRMNGVKGIGFDLQDGSDYAGKFDLMIGGRVQRDVIDGIDHYRTQPLVQKALQDVEKHMTARQKNVNRPTENTTAKEDKSPEPDRKKPEKTQKRKEAVCI